MFETAIAGSLPKPDWLAEPEKLWPRWKSEGESLRKAKAGFFSRMFGGGVECGGRGRRS